jgi:hypothetical protein
MTNDWKPAAELQKINFEGSWPVIVANVVCKNIWKSIQTPDLFKAAASVKPLGVLVALWSGLHTLESS